MRNRFYEEVYTQDPITIKCPYCGKEVPFFPPELEDRDWLMDQDCQICDQRIFADFEFVPKLKAVYRLTAMPGCVDISAEAAHASD